MSPHPLLTSWQQRLSMCQQLIHTDQRRLWSSKSLAKILTYLINRFGNEVFTVEPEVTLESKGSAEPISLKMWNGPVMERPRIRVLLELIQRENS